jgi:hypothetical protein
MCSLQKPLVGYQSLSLHRFHFGELGVASSCRIRFEGEVEYIYVTEREFKEEDDGRGIFFVPINELLNP